SDRLTLVLDVLRTHHAQKGKLHPAIIKVHGGAWLHGSRGLMTGWKEFFDDLGYDVVDIDYRMPPQAQWKDEVAKVKCAMGWLADHAAEYDVDPQRISLLGHSAGGNLSLLAAYSMGDPGLPPSCPVGSVKVRSVINFYGPTDMAKLYADTDVKDYLQPA